VAAVLTAIAGPGVAARLTGEPAAVTTELGRIELQGGAFAVRRAVAEDLETIVALLAADQLGRQRDGGELTPYRSAFAQIDRDPAQLLVVLTDTAGEVVGTLQLTFIPGLARRGALRAQIEAVRVDARLRGHGLGAEMLRWAITEAQRRGCTLVQLTSDKRRPKAHRLYDRLGFVASHEGFKLQLAAGQSPPAP